MFKKCIFVVTLFPFILYLIFMQAFLDFRCSVVERRANFKLSQAQDRYHIVEVCLNSRKQLTSGIVGLLNCFLTSPRPFFWNC